MELIIKKSPKEIYGDDDFVLQEGDQVKIETNLVGGGGEEKLLYTVPDSPSSNSARVRIRVTIEEEEVT